MGDTGIDAIAVYLLSHISTNAAQSCLASSSFLQTRAHPDKDSLNFFVHSFTSGIVNVLSICYLKPFAVLISDSELL